MVLVIAICLQYFFYGPPHKIRYNKHLKKITLDMITGGFISLCCISFKCPLLLTSNDTKHDLLVFLVVCSQWNKLSIAFHMRKLPFSHF